MPVEVSWDNAEQTRIRYHFTGKWTWSDLDTAIQTVNALLASVPHRVYILIHFEAAQIPNGAITELRQRNARPAPNWGGGVFIGVHPLLRILIENFRKIYPPLAKQYAVASSRDEAVAIIDQWQTKERSGL